METEIKIKKCLKSYLTGKKYYNSDINKSFEYFKQCVKILNNIRENNIPLKDNFVDIMNETETECCKYITQTIESTIDEPIINNNIDTNNELFDIIEIGNVNELKKYKYGELNFNTFNSAGHTPLHYSIKFGDISFLKQAFKLGAKIDQIDNLGHTLLEFACLEKDPNMINFLISYGADMKKHLLFREGRKYFNNSNQMDIALIEKTIIDKYFDKCHKIKYLEWIYDYIKPEENIQLELCKQDNSTMSCGKISFSFLNEKLDLLISDFDNDSRDTYINIIKEELKNDLSKKLGCPTNKIEILLYNLIPFINYNNISLDWVLSQEIKFLILRMLKNKKKINTKELKKELSELLYYSYIEPKIAAEGLIQTLVLQWINKIKV